MKTFKPLPSQEYLKEALLYEATSGLLTWKERPLHHFKDSLTKKASEVWVCWNKRFSGKPAFRKKNASGHLFGGLGNSHYLAHRIIWKMEKGYDPDEIDHISGDAADNRMSNLRDVTGSQNHHNMRLYRTNKSGKSGVYETPNGRWVVKIKSVGPRRHVGTFDTFEEAENARSLFEIFLGFHPNHGRKVS